MLCLICNNIKDEFNSTQLSFHLRKEHNYTFNDYLKKYNLWPMCKRNECNNFSSNKKGGYCSRTCNNISNNFIRGQNRSKNSLEQKEKLKKKCANENCSNMILKKYCSILCRTSDKNWKESISKGNKKAFEEGRKINWTDKRLRDKNKELIDKANLKLSNTRKERFKSGEIINWTDKSIRTSEIEEIIEKRKETFKETIKISEKWNESWTDERKKNQSKVLKEVYKNQDLRDKISELVSKSMTKEVRSAISKGICETIVNTNWMENVRKGYKSGNYEAIKGFKKSGLKVINYKSSYELKAFQILDADESIEKWFYESIIIPLDEIKHTVVDLEIYYKNGIKKIIEVKPQKLLNDETNKLKFQKINEYCKLNDYIFEIWTEEEIFK